MSQRKRTRWGRRQMLKAIGASAVGGVALSQPGRTQARETSDVSGEGKRVSQVDGRVEQIEADPDAGFHYPYFLYRPRERADAERPLFVQGNNTPSSDDNYEVHLEQARDLGSRLGSRLAQPFQSPALVPAFPRFRDEPVNWDVNPQTLTPQALMTDYRELERVDLQLKAMIADAKNRLEAGGFDIAEQIHLYGFSSSATFANRFTILHPELVNAVTAGGNGVATLPREELDGRTLLYPAGVADLPDLIGKEFNGDAWRDVDQYIFVGEEDQPLPEDEGRSYKGFYPLSDRRQELVLDTFGENRVTERFPVTRSVYTEAEASAEFQIYEGVGHEVPSNIIADLRRFHRTHMTADDVKADVSAVKSADEVAVGEPLTVTVTVANLASEPVTVPVTLAVDGSDVETREVQVDGNVTETTELETTFDEQGRYSVSVNEDRLGDRVIVEAADTPQPTTAETENPTADSETATATEQPGFGIAHTIAALGTAGYLLKRALKTK